MAPGGQGFALQCGDHPDHVQDLAAFAGRLGRDARHVQLPLFQAECLEGQPVVLARYLYWSETGTPKTCGLVMTRKATG